MDAFTPADLKSIVQSKRANIYYLQHCRVGVKGGRVKFDTDEGKRSLYWNIPIANTTTVMFRRHVHYSGCRARHGQVWRAGGGLPWWWGFAVVVGVCRGGGTPLFTANGVDIEVAWFTPQREYRPIDYLQAWVKHWFDRSVAKRTRTCAGTHG